MPRLCLCLVERREGALGHRAGLGWAGRGSYPPPPAAPPSPEMHSPPALLVEAETYPSRDSQTAPASH